MKQYKTLLIAVLMAFAGAMGTSLFDLSSHLFKSVKIAMSYPAQNYKVDSLQQVLIQKVIDQSQFNAECIKKLATRSEVNTDRELYLNKLERINLNITRKLNIIQIEISKLSPSFRYIEDVADTTMPAINKKLDITLK